MIITYGQTHLEHVYYSQLKNRNQQNESLQEVETDFDRLARPVYSATPENVAFQAFLDALHDNTTIVASPLLLCPCKISDKMTSLLASPVGSGMVNS